ncbi:MAG: hypothetical protein K7J15_02205, partial [Candidatus Regiella insecticola]|nr:hypothetical protein [Candidatus Regiella insecticola]
SHVFPFYLYFISFFICISCCYDFVFAMHVILIANIFIIIIIIIIINIIIVIVIIIIIVFNQKARDSIPYLNTLERLVLQ